METDTASVSSLISCMQGDLWGTLFRRPTIMYHLKSVALISLPKEKLNLIVMIKVTANSQLKKSLPPPLRTQLPLSPALLASPRGKERECGVNKKDKKAACGTFHLSASLMKELDRMLIWLYRSDTMWMFR